MDCFNDFCIACDKESHNGGAYCSQACRLADLERAAGATELTLLRTHSSSSQNYHLRPAYNFSSPKSTGQSTSPPSSYFSSQQSYYADPASLPRSLTPSSSRTSLSSTMSTSSSSTTGGLSERAKAELQRYYNSFDKAREAKRRSSTK